MSARRDIAAHFTSDALATDLLEAFRAEVLTEAGDTLIGLGYEAAGQLLRDTADVVRAPAPRCDVTFVGGGQCTKAAGHRTPQNQDPHTPAAVPVPDETAGDKTAVEFGVRSSSDVLAPTVDRADAERRLARYRDMHPTAALVQRTVRYGAWTEVRS